MIVPERLTDYINSLYDLGNSDYLEDIRIKALEGDVPIIRKEMARFMATILADKKPEKILEVGTAVGYSALFMAEHNPVKCQITTIENYEVRIPIAKANFENSAFSEDIELIEGDALEILPKLEGQYDLIFMDAAKGQYLNFLPDIKRLLKKGGMLLTDNVLQEGDIIESRFLVERRDRTIHKRMRDYLYALNHDEDFTTSVLPVGDGVAVSIKK